MRKLYVVLAAATVVLGCSMTARAQDAERPITEGYVEPKVVIVCVITAEGVVRLRDEEAGIDEELNASVSGEANLLSLDNTDEDRERSEADRLRRGRFSLEGLTISGNDPTYGDFSFSLSGAATENSTIVANNPDQDFPATADIYANASGTVSGLEGTFTNSNTCHMQNTNLNTFNPQNGETYQFVEDVVFTSDKTNATFTIPAGASVTVN